MLDKNLRVRRFSSKAAEMFKLEDGEVGERIEILSSEVPELPKLASRVMRRREGLKRKSCGRTATIIRCASDLI